MIWKVVVREEPPMEFAGAMLDCSVMKLNCHKSVTVSHHIPRRESLNIVRCFISSSIFTLMLWFGKYLMWKDASCHRLTISPAFSGDSDRPPESSSSMVSTYSWSYTRRVRGSLARQCIWTKWEVRGNTLVNSKSSSLVDYTCKTYQVFAEQRPTMDKVPLFPLPPLATRQKRAGLGRKVLEHFEPGRMSTCHWLEHKTCGDSCSCLSNLRVRPDDVVDEVPPPRGDDAEAPQVAAVGVQLHLQDLLQDLRGQRVHRGGLRWDRRPRWRRCEFLRTFTFAFHLHE